MNTDGSHGPLKCGACHEANDNGVNKATAQLIYEGQEIGQNYDAAVSWMHEYTDEADPRTTICLRCHDDNSAMVSSTNGKWNNHAKQGRASRDSMDKVEILQNGHVNGDSAFEDPLATLCISCHRDKSDILASNGCSTRWKNHLIEGRASESVWEDVSTSLTGGTCGY
jgi:cytochrome c553